MLCDVSSAFYAMYDVSSAFLCYVMRHQPFYAMHCVIILFVLLCDVRVISLLCCVWCVISLVMLCDMSSACSCYVTDVSSAFYAMWLTCHQPFHTTWLMCHQPFYVKWLMCHQPFYATWLMTMCHRPFYTTWLMCHQPFYATWLRMCHQPFYAMSVREQLSKDCFHCDNSGMKSVGCRPSQPPRQWRPKTTGCLIE